MKRESKICGAKNVQLWANWDILEPHLAEHLEIDTGDFIFGADPLEAAKILVAFDRQIDAMFKNHGII